jgi:carboxyl-terminal processing protease
MRRLRGLLFMVLALLLVSQTLLSQTPLFQASARQDLLASAEGRELVFNALVDVFRHNYWNENHLDWDAWADQYRDAALEATSHAAFDSVARRMVNAIGDGHSNWIGRVSYVESEDLIPRERARVGIGIQHAFLPGVGIVVERVFPNTPAEQAGLKRGDVIIRVNGEDVRSLASSYLVDNTLSSAIVTRELKLGVRRRQAHLNVDLTPEPVRFDEVQAIPQAEMLDATTGYIYLPTFNVANVAHDVHARLDTLQQKGAESLVLDLRGNLGGRLSELGLVLGAFIEGPWAQAVSRGSITWQSSYEVKRGQGFNILAGLDDAVFSEQILDNPVRFNGPLAVLVNEQNSSAGEIAAMVLQSMGRATIIGQATSGNVEAVRGFDLPDGSLVMVAVANVQSIQGDAFDRGVQPDIEAYEDLHELARGFDAPLSEAVRVLKGLPFTPGRYF